MNCPRCGAPVNAGQAHCACGQYLPRVSPDTDLPAAFYNRIERQVAQSGKDNFRRGLLLGLGFLALFLFLEMLVDRSSFAQSLLVILSFAAMLGLSGFNIWLFIRDQNR